MKFTVQMKDPDTLHDAISDAIAELPFPDLSKNEADRVREMRGDEVRELCGKWFEYGEYLTVEIDTDAQTCVVVPRK